MADLGTAVAVVGPVPTALGTYGYGPALDFGTAKLVGGSSSTFTPKRYLNVGGVATPIQ